jgi:hypothetical protein
MQRSRSRIRAFLISAAFAGLAASSLHLHAQEPKKVPKDSVRISVPGCTKGYVFTAAPRDLDEPGSLSLREGMHVRMNGPKKLMAEIKAHEGSRIEITGLMRKGQYDDGVNLGHGVRIGPGSSNASVTGGLPQIDVEGWRPLAGDCPTR